MERFRRVSASVARLGATLGLLAALAVPATAADPMGPPEPPDRATASRLPEPRRVVTPEARQAARDAWRWYAAGWALDVGSTALVFSRHGDAAAEANPILGDRPALVAGAKLALGVGAWRLGVHWTDSGHPERATALRRIFLALSAAAGAWNVSVAF